jgi:hypothetical protein
MAEDHEVSSPDQEKGALMTRIANRDKAVGFRAAFPRKAFGKRDQRAKGSQSGAEPKKGRPHRRRQSQHHASGCGTARSRLRARLRCTTAH